MTMKLAAGLCLAVTLAPCTELDSSSAAITRFYQTYGALKITGLPDSGGLAKLSPFLSASLQKLLGAAKADQARCQKAHPDEKPPWIEGDLFSSNFEGFTRVRVIGAGTAQGAARAVHQVTFEYTEPGMKEPVRWTDEVATVKQPGGRWVIDDVVYRMHAAFGNGMGRSLRAGLAGKGCP